MKGIRGPLRVQKHTGIGHADFWCRILFQDASDQGFGKRLAGCHQLQRQQGRIFITRIDSHSFASRVKCTCSLAGHCTHPSDGDPGRSPGLFSIQVIGQGLLDDASRHFLVGHPHEPARNRGDDAGAIPQGCGSQFRSQEGADIGQAVQRQHQLQGGPLRLAGFRLGLHPGSCRLQGGFPGP
jgi:hypothetical protein